MNKISLAFIVTVCLICAQSCKKGCTDPTAINYVHGVTHDNGSCLYCDSTVFNEGNNFTTVIDNNPSSQHYDNYVMQVTAISNIVQYTGNGCQILGLGVTNNTGCTATTFTAVLSNQTSSTMVVSGQLNISVQAASFNYAVSSLSISPFGTDTISLGRACADGFVNISFLNPTFQYH